MSNSNENYFKNRQGAKVYYDYRLHDTLEIPDVKDTSEDGIVYDVLAVGFFGFLDKPHITIAIDGQAELFLLPDDLIGWVMHCMSVAQQGTNFFPEKVEFGYLLDVDRIYAELY